jgi:hypothetical protein
MTRRRRVLVALAALALAVLPVSAAVAGDDKDPPPPPTTCATGQYTSFHVQEVVMNPQQGTRVFVYLEGWIGPCAELPLPPNFRQLPYYPNSAVSHMTSGPTEFTSPTEPTLFSGYFGVDLSLAGQVVAVCLAGDRAYPVDCLRLTGLQGMGGPTLERVPVSYVIEHVNPWPPNTVIAATPDPTCGTCL